MQKGIIVKIDQERGTAMIRSDELSKDVQIMGLSPEPYGFASLKVGLAVYFEYDIVDSFDQVWMATRVLTVDPGSDY